MNCVEFQRDKTAWVRYDTRIVCAVSVFAQALFDHDETIERT